MKPYGTRQWKHLHPVRNLMFYYNYVIQSLKDKQWYSGCTNDLWKRLAMHNAGKILITKNRRPFKLIYCEACLNKEDAYMREKYLKTGMGKRYLRNRLKKFLTGQGI